MTAAKPGVVEIDPDGDLVLTLNEDKDEDSVIQPGVDGSAGTNDSLRKEDPDLLEESSNKPANLQPTPREVRVRVSSKHLKLASRPLKACLQPGFQEGDSLQKAGCGELSLPDDNVPALIVLLNIIHGKVRAVPRKINTAMLVKMVILIDKYELHEVAEVFTELWFDELKESVPTTLTDDLTSWMCISWVLRKNAELKRTTEIAQKEGKGRIQADGLPIPDVLLDTINERRQAVLAELISYLHYLVAGEKLRFTCLNKRCEALMLGSLIIGLKSLGLMLPPNQPYPITLKAGKDACDGRGNQPVYNGFSFWSLATRLRDMEILTDCQTYCYSTCVCFQTKGMIITKINTLEQRLSGLELNVVPKDK